MSHGSACVSHGSAFFELRCVDDRHSVIDLRVCLNPEQTHLSLGAPGEGVGCSPKGEGSAGAEGQRGEQCRTDLARFPHH